MKYSVEEIKNICNGHLAGAEDESTIIDGIIFDSRRISESAGKLFIALSNPHNDGHHYINDAYQKGIRHFLVQKLPPLVNLAGATFIKVENTLAALGALARYHRSRFNLPVIGITGSNGKTIVKEWMANCLNRKYMVAKTPLSFNSQIGVPLSVLSLHETHERAVFEAGISMPGEMIIHKESIRPDVGIFTNLGDAHDAGFRDRDQKILEKLKLFDNADAIIYARDQDPVAQAIEAGFPGKNLMSWGHHPDSKLQIISENRKKDYTTLSLLWEDQSFDLILPFRHENLIENCMHIIVYLLFDGWTVEEIQAAASGLSPLSHRLQMKEGLRGCLLINDSYSLDLSSLKLALDYQDQYTRTREKVLFISDFDQPEHGDNTIAEMNRLLEAHDITHCVALGFEKGRLQPQGCRMSFYTDTRECLEHYPFEQLEDACILIKGARKFKMEEIFRRLSPQVHDTVLETDFGAIAHNLRVYRSMLEPDTALMPVIKAEAYGSGSIQLAHFLETRNVAYIAVAIADEAIKIRQAGSTQDIMIFNIQDTDPELLWTYRLEPEVYSLSLLEKLDKYAEQSHRKLSIHLKIDTGMNRLGFGWHDLDDLVERLQQSTTLEVKSIFSHLAASDNSRHDEFTRQQIERFEQGYRKISEALSYKPLRHLLNTAGIVRFPDHQYDMVRIGLGLYGIDETGLIGNRLEPAHSLKARVLQVRKLDQDDSTGYNRSGRVKHPTHIAVIGIGYADGLMRNAGNGNFSVRIHNNYYPTIGNICMDVTMIDIGNTNEVSEGDEVIIFDREHSIDRLASACDTISYEVISRIAPRVRRLYIHQ